MASIHARHKAATIIDVARRAGVSPMTVSRVVNGEANVRPQTRETVHAAIAELGYAPNQAARALARVQPIRIGLLYSTPASGVLSEFLVGSLDYAARAHVQLVVERADPNEGDAHAIERQLKAGMDGLLLPPLICDDPAVLDVMRRHDALGVAVASGAPATDFSSVNIDDERAAYDMGRHIIGLGHQRIGFITGNPSQTASACRLRGYRAALADAGLPIDETLVVPGLFTYRSGLDAAERLIERDDPPTAIFASNDDMAAATVAVAHRHRLDVPGDLTVCGFDDTAMAVTIWPELTTIHQPITDMALDAVELLVEEVRARRQGRPREVTHRTLDFTLVRRQSDAAPRRRPPSIGSHG